MLIGLSLGFELAPDSYWLLLAVLALCAAGVAASAYLAYLCLAVLRAVRPLACPRLLA